MIASDRRGIRFVFSFGFGFQLRELVTGSRQSVLNNTWTEQLGHLNTPGRAGVAGRRRYSGIVGHSWTLGAALRSICSWKLTPKKLCSCDGTGPEWTVCGLCVDCVWIVCGLAIGALWLLTVNRGNQERMFRMRQSVNGRWARKIWQANGKQSELTKIQLC